MVRAARLAVAGCLRRGARRPGNSVPKCPRCPGAFCPNSGPTFPRGCCPPRDQKGESCRVGNRGKKIFSPRNLGQSNEFHDRAARPGESSARGGPLLAIPLSRQREPTPRQPAPAEGARRKWARSWPGVVSRVGEHAARRQAKLKRLRAFGGMPCCLAQDDVPTTCCCCSPPLPVSDEE